MSYIIDVTVCVGALLLVIFFAWETRGVHVEDLNKTILGRHIIDITVCVVALLLVFGIFFAWETRGVCVEALNKTILG